MIKSEIQMIKICASSVLKPLHLIFRSYLETETFLKLSKKASIIFVNKKCYKQLVANNRPLSPLPICGNLFEKIFLIWLFDYLNNSNLLSSIQSEFGQDDSFVHQLILIAYYISKVFHATPLLEVRGAFLGSSEVLVKVSDEVFLYKLKRVGIYEKYLGLINSIWSDRYQTKFFVIIKLQSGRKLDLVFLRGVNSSTFIFLVYINNLPGGITSNARLCTCDFELDFISSSLSLNEALCKILQQAMENAITNGKFY